MNRYMMTIPEAVELVIEAAEKGKNGETWVMDMNKKVNVLELAQRVIELSGEQKEIKTIGVRKGEMLEEEIMTEEERKLAKKYNKFYIIP